jgi:hypothetical protein
MYTSDFIEFLGWITAVSFGIAILNFFSKYIHKHYVSKLGKEHQQVIDLYRKVMKLIIKNHKLAGFVAVAAVLTHFFIAYSNGMIYLTGSISAIIMGTIFVLGFYGAFINKNYKAWWLKAHRLLAFALIFTIGAHVLLKI